MLISPYLEKVIDHFSQGAFKKEIHRAKVEYAHSVGQSAENESNFEQQMNDFLDWYLFVRLLPQHDLTPIKLFCDSQLKDLDADEKLVFENLRESINSLFVVIAQKERDLYLKDLFDREIYLIENCEIISTFHKGDIFQGRLIRFRDVITFGQSFVFHPAEAKKFIMKEARVAHKMPAQFKEQLLYRLRTMKLKSLQYPHVDPDQFYAKEPLL